MSHRSSPHTFMKLAGIGLLATTTVLVSSQSANAAIVPTVNLATSANYSVLAGSTVTNTGPSVIGQSVGLAPGSAVVGFPPGQVLGVTDAANATALQAQADLTVAYVDAANRPVDATTSGELGGLTLVGGVYNGPSNSPLQITGPLVLDGQGDPNSVFIFQTASTLTTASGSTIALINGASECNVFWQVGSSATLGSGSLFVGNILALTAITVTSSTVVHGRALARNAAVTLDNNVFTAPSCAPSIDTVPNATAPSTTTTTTTPTSTATTLPPPVEGSTPAGDSTPPTTGPPTGTGVDNTLIVNRDQTTTTFKFTVTDITIPPTGSSSRTMSIAASALLVAGLAALLIARRRSPI